MNSKKILFRRINIDSIPGGHGLYAFWNRNTGRCIYVGKAEKQSVQTRLYQHWDNKKKDKLYLWLTGFTEQIDFCYRLMKNNALIDEMETQLIERWNPEANNRKKSK